MSHTTIVTTRTVSALRITAALIVVCILAYAYALRIAVGDDSPWDYFGYFTNQTALLAAVVLLWAGIRIRSGGGPSVILIHARAVTTTCLVIVGLIYNLLVPGTGTAPVWVSVSLHVVLPLFVLADWILAPDRRPLPWRTMWLVLPYPLAWLSVVLFRGATDGWVPYGFLLPDRGAASLWIHIAGLVCALLAVAAAVWLLSRVRLRHRSPTRSAVG